MALKPSLVDVSEGYPKLTVVYSEEGTMSAVDKVTNACMCEWINSIGRCSALVENVTRAGRDGYLYLLPALSQQAPYCIWIKVFHFAITRSAWFFFFFLISCRILTATAPVVVLINFLARPAGSKLVQSRSCTANMLAGSFTFTVSFDCGYRKVICLYHTN